MRPIWAPVAAAGLVLAACAATPPPKPIASLPVTPPSPSPVAPLPSPLPSPANPTETVSLSQLPGWAQDDHAAALAAFQAGCGAARDPSMRAACQSARALGRADDRTARAFFERCFRAEPAGDPPGAEGVLTAYFAPEYEARDTPDSDFSAPVRPKPTRPVEVARPIYPSLDRIDAALGDTPSAYPAARIDLSTADRATIERASPDGALAWMRPEDLFFLQIQGSGTLSLPNGRRLKATYTADNGKPFTAIARPMVNQGLLGANGASGDAIRGWLAAHKGAEAQAIMQLNARYVFFAVATDDGRDPAGAAGIPLPAGRAIAIDPGRHAYGELFWIDASAPVLSGAARTYRRVVMALDTGSAIRGAVRADLYIGRGTAAGGEAGRVRHTLKLTRLVPVDRSARGTASDETPASPGGG